ncbi:MAG: hypothetical protein R3B09_22235 [Nannocystaceae bacterium]
MCSRVVFAALLLLTACGRNPAPDAAPKVEEKDKLLPEIPSPLEFRDADPGPRSPVTKIFGVDLGATHHTEVEAMTQRLGLKCSDTSIRAMMESKREAERKKMAERGEDAVSSASWMKKKSKREANPQIRYSCPKVQSQELTDRARPPSTGRLLYVFDSADHPVRHVSYQRSHTDHEAAYADLEDSINAMTAIFGDPTGDRGQLPERVDGKVTFAPNRQYEVRWEYSDVVVRVTAIQFGPNKVTIGERVEVPHGVRPDAPQIGRPPGGAAPTPAPSRAATSLDTPEAPAPSEPPTGGVEVVEEPAREPTPGDRGPLG